MNAAEHPKYIDKQNLRQFYWLDDDPDRVSDELRYQLEHPEAIESLPASVTIVSLKQMDVPVQVANMLKKPKADLVIIDHVLNRASHTSIMKEGSSIAVTVRESWPEVPVVGVTGKFNTKAEKFRRVSEQEYIELFDVSAPSQDIPSFHAICQGFRLLHEKLQALESTPEIPVQEAIVKLLECPEGDRSDFTAILPSEFKGESNAAISHLLSRWIWHQFTEKPGLLYDERYAAVLLGLTSEGFQKVASHFDDAKFKGIFASEARPRWWVSLLKSRLLEIVPDPKFLPTLQRGRLLEGITPEDYSRAYFSQADDPDTLAAGDVITQELHPEKLRFTEVHPAETLLVGFEPRRIYKQPVSK